MEEGRKNELRSNGKTSIDGSIDNVVDESVERHGQDLDADADAAVDRIDRGYEVPSEHEDEIIHQDTRAMLDVNHQARSFPHIQVNMDEISINNYMNTRRDRPGAFPVRGPRDSENNNNNNNSNALEEGDPSDPRCHSGPDTADLPVAECTQEIVAFPVLSGDSIQVHNLTQIDQEKRKMKQKLLLALLVILIPAVVIIAVLVSRLNRTSPKKAQPISEESDEIIALRSNFLAFNISHESALRDPESPQYEALNWIANEDTNNKTISFLNMLTQETENSLDFTSHMDHPIVQRYVLATIYFSTNGQYWTKQARFLSELDECQWKDVDDPRITQIQCDEQTQTVQGVYLYSLNASGKFPNEIGLLSNVETFFMGDNVIQGTLPSTMSKMTNLKNFHIAFGELTGTLPFLGNLKNMSFFSVWNNRLRGTIPIEMAVMEHIDTIHLGNNLFEGDLPDMFGNMYQLSRFYAGGNRLSSTIPSSLQNRTTLNVLSIGENELFGTIPTFLGGFVRLQELKLNDNSFHGTIPGSFGNLTRLETMDLSYNEITGQIPTTFIRMLELEDIDVSHNRISGDVNFLCEAKEGDHTNFFPDRKFINFKADCRNLLNCSCCTQCF